MDFQGKKVGIWGFGIVGKAALNYLRTKNAHIEILDNKSPSQEDASLLQAHNIRFRLQATDLDDFLAHNDCIIPSPGINRDNYTQYTHKWISELDIFASEYNKPIVAITGTIGKTSITHLLGQILSAHAGPIALGGNIGTGMLTLLDNQSRLALLEVSSFQLELCHQFAPTLAMWTNFYPNHLDRHGTEQHYFDAKYRIIAEQQETECALLPLALQQKIYTTHPIKSAVSFFCSHKPTEQELATLRPQDALFYDDGTHFWHYAHGIHTPLIARVDVPSISYKENWLIICAALHILKMPVHIIRNLNNISLPEHRLEKVATINSVVWYNDSKSTTPQATLAAVQQLHGNPIHLLLGGISKGIDRTALIQHLKGAVHHVYCFGKEAEQLHQLCAKNNISASAHALLESALQECTIKMRPGDQVLFSPAGASFDLFKDYVERGNYFKQLVCQIKKNLNR